ncbi:MAG: 16S rRNA (cytosine(1402)-N(4))-methyltransferase RsmH [Defluviitaleaceae bacterium]|nr:16S rRNA (cytosine(1402)-N(4))-methyltransferase RsmH [Defluviitaleaceae bacterium]MCL2275515.1 16S rRNA (cytosine(1402)-N(4))-methyltransferase RsmH [Defluviitaleaceae bacterium]
MFRHLPVLPNETIQALAIKPGGTYVDGTLGGGGHSALITDKLEGGTLIGIDRDTQALQAAKARVAGIIAVHGNFHDMPDILHAQGIENVDGVLLDLGVSSHQLDTAERGFSFRFDAALDMRMNRQSEGITAADIVNTFPRAELTRILYQYGEEKFTPRIVNAICKVRETTPINTTFELVKIIESAIPAKMRDKHPAMRTFMALRIAVNDELAPLENALQNIAALLNKGARFAIITFHSLEDRIVKHTLRTLANPCTCPRDIPYCACGNVPILRVITRSPILPSKQELEANPRANSAKLRVAERI